MDYHMFNSIPGNNDYIISLSTDIRDVNGNVVNNPLKSLGKIRLELYGKIAEYCLEWLSLISHYEIHVPEPSHAKLMGINFLPVNVMFFKRNSSQTPYFKKPLTVKIDNEVYRVIPNYSRYVISRKGQVVEFGTKRLLEVSYPSSDLGWSDTHYPTVRIYSPDKKNYHDAYVHRLVADAWLIKEDSDLILRPLVNHKDGNKANFEAANLELCSFSENSLHAYSEGLRTDNIECKVRDFETTKVYEFPSKSQAAEFMGISKTSLNHSTMIIRKGKLYNDRFEFKLKGDNTPWFYENRKDKIVPGRYVIFVKNKLQGELIDELYSTVEFKNKYKLWNIGNIKDLVIKAKELYPKLEFSYIDHYKAKPIQIKNLGTGEVLEFNTINEAAQHLGKPKGRVRYALRHKKQTSIANHAVRFKTDKRWKDVDVNLDLDRAISVTATNKITGEVKEFPSIRSLQRVLKIDPRMVKDRIGKNRTEVDNWVIE